VAELFEQVVVLWAAVVLVIVGGGEVQVVRFDAAGEAGVAAFPVEGVVGEDESLVEGGALGLVERGGVAVGEVSGLGEVKGIANGRPRASTDSMRRAWRSMSVMVARVPLKTRMR
jgi:hypothetical protein